MDKETKEYFQCVRHKRLMRDLIEDNLTCKHKKQRIKFYTKALLIKITPTYRKLNKLLGWAELSSEKIQDCYIDELEAYLSVLSWDYKVTKSDKSLLFWNKITISKE